MDTINQTQVATNGLGYWAEQAEALARLEENKDFQKVILEGYFKDKAVAGTSILANDRIKEGGRRTDVMEGLIAISALQDHLSVIKDMGRSIADEADEDYEDGTEAVEASEIVGA